MTNCNLKREERVNMSEIRQIIWNLNEDRRKDLCRMTYVLIDVIGNQKKVIYGEKKKQEMKTVNKNKVAGRKNELEKRGKEKEGEKEKTKKK